MLKGRVSRVDTDFEHSRRGEVIEYIRNKYGVDKVSQIITFGTLAPKMAVKDVGRVLGFPAGFTQNLAKMIPDEPKMTIAKALDMNPELNERYKNDPDVEYIIDVAKKLEGCKRHSSQHACGILIGPQPLYNFFPTAMVVDEETGVPSVTSQVQCFEAEELSILKMDLLGLKNLSVIHESIDNIVKKTGKPLDYHDIPLNDRAVYKFLSQRNTGGVFQLESEGMTKVIAGMFTDIDEIPEEEMNQCFERLVAAVALYRPGPMAYIDDYIKGMKDSSKIHYDHPSLEPILKSTYGIIVYQEQVMQIVQKLAGYTLGRADLVRKSMGKKKQKIMDQEKYVFIYGNKEAYESGKDANYAPGCIANGIPEETATIIWNKMADFAKYAFNRSHAVCYAYISAITAWLSCYYPVEFYSAMLNAFRLQSDKVKTYLAQIYHRDIKILPPDINRSATVYSVEDNSIRYGLSGIKGVNKFMDNVIKERDNNGEFHSFQDFMERMDKIGHPIGKKEIEGLVYSGALDCFDLTKSSMLSFYEVFSKDLAKNKKRLEGQYSIFDMEQFSELAVIDIPRIPEFKKRELMEKEQEMLGIYLSGHPVDIYEQMMVNGGKMISISDCINKEYEGDIATVGMIKDFRKVWTKKEEEMLLFRVENRLDNIPCVIFPREAARLKAYVQEGKIIMLYGKLVENENYGKQIIVNNIIPESEALERMMSQKFMARIYVPVMNKEQQTKLLDIVKKFQTKSEGAVVGLQMQAKGRLYPSCPYQLRHSNAVIEAISTAFPGTQIKY